MEAPAPFTPRRRASAHGDSALDGMISALAPGTPASTIVYQGDTDEAITLNNSRLDLLANMVPIAELAGRAAFDTQYGSFSRDVSANAAGTGLLTSAAGLARAVGGSVAFATSLAAPPKRARSTSRPRRQNLYAQRAPFTPEHVKLYYEHSVRAPVVPEEEDERVRDGQGRVRQAQPGATTGLGPGQGGQGGSAALDVSAAAPRALHFTDDMRDGGENENEDPRLGLGLAQRAVLHALRLPAVTGPVRVVQEGQAQGQQAVVDARFLRTLKAKKVGANAASASAPVPVPVHGGMHTLHTGAAAGAAGREHTKAQIAGASGQVIVSKSVAVRPVVPAPAPSLAQGRAQAAVHAASHPDTAQHSQQHEEEGYTGNDGGGRGPAAHPAAVPAVRALTQAFEAAASEPRRYGQDYPDPSAAVPVPALPAPAASKDGRQAHSMMATAAASPATATRAEYVGGVSPATAPSASSPTADSPGLLVAAVSDHTQGSGGGAGGEEARARADMWRSARSPEGKVYYYHRHTRQTTWDLPADVPVHLVKATKYAGGGGEAKAQGGQASTGKRTPARTPARMQEAPAATVTVPSVLSAAGSPTRAVSLQLSPARVHHSHTPAPSQHAQGQEQGGEATGVVMSPKEYLRSLIIQERAARRDRSLSTTPASAYGRAASAHRARSTSQSVLAGLDSTHTSVVEQETGIEGLQPIAVVAGQSIQYMDMDSTTAEQRESVIMNVSHTAGRVARDLRGAHMDGVHAHAHGMQEHGGAQGATKLSYKSYASAASSDPAEGQEQEGTAAAAFVIQEASVETSTATSTVPQKRSAYLPPEREEDEEAAADVTSTTIGGPDPDYTIATVLPAGLRAGRTRDAEATQQGLEAAEDDPNARAPCQDCGRFFHPSRLAVHRKACKQVFGTRRSPYPTAVVRLKDTPASSLNFTSKTIPPCSHCGKKFPVESDAREHALTCRRGRHAGAGQGQGQGQGGTSPGRVRSANATGNLWSAAHAAGAVEGGVNTTQSLAASASILEFLHNQQQEQAEVVWPTAAAWHEGAGDSQQEEYMLAREAQDTSHAQPLPVTAGGRNQRAATSSSVVRRSVGRVGSGTRGNGRGRTLPVHVAWPAAAEDAAPAVSAAASIVLPTPAVARKLPFASPGGAASAPTQGVAEPGMGLRTTKGGTKVVADDAKFEWEGESAEAVPATAAAAPTGALALLKTKMRAGSASASVRTTRHTDTLAPGMPMGHDHYSQTPAASSGAGSASSHASGSSAGGGVFTPDPVELISPALSSAPMPAPAPAPVGRELPQPVHPAMEPVAPAAVPAAVPTMPSVPVPMTEGVIDARVQRGVSKPSIPGAHRAAPATAPAAVPMEAAAVEMAAPSPQVRRSRAAVRASTPCTCAACGLVLPDPGQLVEHLGVCGGWARRLQTHVSAWSAQSRPGAVPGDDEGEEGEEEGGGIEQAGAVPASSQREEYSEEEQEPSAIEMEQSTWPSSTVPYKASSSPVGKAVARALFLSPSASPDTTTLSTGASGARTTGLKQALHGAYHRQNAVSVSPMDRAMQGGAEPAAVVVVEDDSLLLHASRPKTAPGSASSSPSMEDPASLPVGSPGRLAALAAAAEAAAANARAQAQHAAAAAALVAELQESAGLAKGKGAAVAHARSGGAAGISRIPVPSSQAAQGHAGAVGPGGKAAMRMGQGAQASPPPMDAAVVAQHGRTPRM